MLVTIGGVALAAAVAFAGYHAHQARKHSKAMKTVGCVLAFIAGLLFLVSVVGDWATNIGATIPLISLAGFIVALAFIVFDWFNDGEPDRPTFFSAMALPILFVVGFVNFGVIVDLTQQGFDRVSSTVSQQVGE